jgi:hypothetical protein
MRTMISENCAEEKRRLMRGDRRNGVSKVTYHDALKVVPRQGLRKQANVNVRHPESMNFEIPTYNYRRGLCDGLVSRHKGTKRVSMTYDIQEDVEHVRADRKGCDLTCQDSQIDGTCCIPMHVRLLWQERKRKHETHQIQRR